jgi:hypothetical protein
MLLERRSISRSRRPAVTSALAAFSAVKKTHRGSPDPEKEARRVVVTLRALSVCFCGLCVMISSVNYSS